ncbi:MAG TPA: hypothetical protein VFC19_39920, partial [Candidatus Limnocylindrales bacterium]|nr:hypothetical protein [Candidatus Limnocylindrales bacterium]
MNLGSAGNSGQLGGYRYPIWQPPSDLTLKINEQQEEKTRVKLTADCPAGAVMDRGPELRAPTRIRTPSRTGTAIGSTTATRLVRGRCATRLELAGALADADADADGEAEGDGETEGVGSAPAPSARSVGAT